MVLIKNMNIALIVYSNYSSDARVRRYAEVLAEDGHLVDVICLRENYIPKEKKIRLIQYPIRRIRRGISWYVIDYFMFFLYSFFILSINYFSKKYKIVHVNNMPDFLVFTAIVPKILGSKIILDMHDPMPELYMSKFHVNDNNIFVRLLKIVEKTAFLFADKVITANDVFRQLFLSRNDITDNHISVILNCPDNNIFNNNFKRIIKDKYFNVIYMGTVDDRFRIDLTISTMPVLIKKIPNIRLVIIPKIEEEGIYFQNLKKSVTEKKLENFVIFKKPLPLEKIAEELKSADIGIVLADNNVFTDKIFPVKLLEFIQMKIPIIATKTKLLGKYFTDKEIFFLPENSVDEFSKAVTALFNNPRLRGQLTTNANKYLLVNN